MKTELKPELKRINNHILRQEDSIFEVSPNHYLQSKESVQYESDTQLGSFTI